MTSQSTALTKHVLYLNGLNCANCAGKIEETLQKDSSLKEVAFSFATKKLIFFSNYLTDDAISYIQTTVDSIEDGVSVSSTSYSSHIDECTDDTCAVPPKKSLLQKHLKEILGSTLLVGLVIYGQYDTLSILGYILAYVLIGGDIALTATKNLLKGRIFDENFLMTLATVGAFALGEYVEAVAVMFFYKIGEAFQDYAVDHSRNSIKELLDITAEYANLVIGDSSQQVDPSSLNVSDVILIKPGEKIPVDCTVISGQSAVNTAALTGESLPTNVQQDSILLSGSINIDAPIKAKVTNKFEDSTVSKILEMVENASSKKAKTEQFITKFAKYYTPLVVLAATGLALFPPLLGYGSFNEWVSRALIFLVISCPCALVISVPLGFFGGLGAASRNGILIKGGNYLEALNKVDTFVFDKTGTLTKGIFAVQSVTDDYTLELASLLEVHSTHPIAQSVLKAYKKDVSINAVTDVIEIPGEGLSGLYKDSMLLVGNSRLMDRYKITYNSSTFVGTIVYVALNNKFIGQIHIADEIKESSHGLVEKLKAIGARKTVMLTGDQKAIADKVASTLNLDTVESQLLPQDKLTIVESLIDSNHNVLFVGDGINDAPVLARADIGVAMGGVGSDAAIEAADIVLMTDEPDKLLTAKKIAKRTRIIVIQNIIFALSVKAFFLSLGAMGEATMYEAIFADVGVALIAVINSMRTLKVKE